MAVSVTQNGMTIEAEQETAQMLLYLREQIADSALWRALVALPRATWADVKAKATLDDASRPNALAAIEFDRKDLKGDAQKGPAENSEVPICFLRPWDEWVQEFAATATWDVTGLILMTFEIPVPTSYRATIQLATVDFWNKMDRIIKEIMEQDYVAERVNRPIIRRVILPGEIDPIANNGRHVRTAAYSVQAKGGN